MERGILTVPLSKSGRTRHVILSEAALSILRGLSSWMHSPYLFPSPLNLGQPMQGRHFVVKVFEPALEAAMIEGATWHTLRHTFASRAVMAGVDIRTVQELMGHSTITMTMRYAHLSPAHLRAAVNRASLGESMTSSKVGTVTKTVTNDVRQPEGEKEEITEAVEELAKVGGGAERVRTAASQFCRLLPYHLGTAPHEGGIIVWARGARLGAREEAWLTAYSKGREFLFHASRARRIAARAVPSHLWSHGRRPPRSLRLLFPWRAAPLPE